MHISNEFLGEFLVDRGVLSRRQVEDALQQAGGKPLYQALGEMGLVEEDELRRSTADALGVPFVELSRHDIDPAALLLIPEPLARAHQLAAYRLVDDMLEVAVLDLDDLSALEGLPLGYRVAPRLTSRASLTAALLHYQKLLREKFSALLKDGAGAVEALVHHALLSRAHGIHIDLHTTGTLVRYRVGHALNEAMELPAHVGHSLVEKLKVLAKLLPTSHTVQEGRFKIEKDGERHTVHVHASPRSPGGEGERLTLRLARAPGARAFTLESLGVHGRALEELYAALSRRSGLVLVAGPVHSGVTTLLYTLLDLLNTPGRSLTSVEESVEHRLPYVLQMQIDRAAGLNTAATLRAALRQDPDVVMVANIADGAAAALAAGAAARGTLVLAGIVADSAAGAIEKLQEFGVPPLVVASTLRAAVATRLVGKLALDAPQRVPARAELAALEGAADFGAVLAALKEEGIVGPDTKWKEVAFGAGQEENAPAGYTGLQEVLPVTEPVKELIMRGAGVEVLADQARREGMLTLTEDGLFKAAQGITSIKEVFRLPQG